MCTCDARDARSIHNYAYMYSDEMEVCKSRSKIRKAKQRSKAAECKRILKSNLDECRAALQREKKAYQLLSRYDLYRLCYVVCKIDSIIYDSTFYAPGEPKIVMWLHTVF